MIISVMISGSPLFSLKKSPRNIRRRLLRDITLVVTVATVVLLTIVLYQGRGIRKESSAAIIADTTLIAKKRFIRFAEPIETFLHIGTQWGKMGMFVPKDPAELTEIFLPMLSTYPHIAAVSLAGADGSEFFLKREKGKWLSRTSREESGGRLANWQEWQDGKMVNSWQEKIDYDPRQRPWFQAAVEKGQDTITWTEPYSFFTGGHQGITASCAWLNSAEKDLSVIAFDILQNDLLEFLNSLKAGRQGHILLIDKNGSPIVHNQYFQQKLHDQVLPVAQAMEIWRGKGQQEIRAMEFPADRQTWWAGFTMLRPETPQNTSWMAVIVPESEIMGSVRERWLRIGAGAAAVLVAGFVMALFLVRKYSYQLRDLPAQKISSDNPEEELQELIAAGESLALEFKSTLRTNLNTGKPGKEIELAWLKTVTAFMNSDGGIVLIGVQDNGDILGIEADGFENEDKCRLHFKNLINHHVGPEFSRFIHLKIREMQGKVILVIECERVRKPVFLLNGKNEDFYVRSGPSSLKLSMSQMVKYLEERR